jgi:hypothetical protein
MATSQSSHVDQPVVVMDALAVVCPYESSRDHLWHELERIDQLIRAQTLRWRKTIGASKSAEFWGMVHVTEAEVEAFLQSSFVPPGVLPPELETEMSKFWRSAEAISQEIVERQSCTPETTSLRLRRLQALFNLSGAECDVILICLLSELDSRYRRLFGYLQDDASRTQPCIELVLQVLHPWRLPDFGRSLFDPGSRLFLNQLLVWPEGAHSLEPLQMRPLRVDDRITRYLLEDDTLDGRLLEFTAPMNSVAWDTLQRDPAEIKKLQSLAEWYESQKRNNRNNRNSNNDEHSRGATFFLRGAYGSGRSAAAAAICSAAGILLLSVDVEKALKSSLGWKQAVDLVFREALLQDAALYWSKCDALLSPLDAAATNYWNYLIHAAEDFPGLCFLAAETIWDPAGRFRGKPFLRLEFPAPNYDLRRRLWEAHLPEQRRFANPHIDRSALGEALANSFQITEGQVLDVLGSAWSQAIHRSPENPRLIPEDLYEGCRRQSSRHLGAFAKRIEPRTELNFDDLVLPAISRKQLEDLRSRMRHQNRVYSGLGFERRLSLGKGLIALFTGSTGTGKTMAAELLAREQGVDLYKVDLSAVVSKYVGETEKNLKQVFAEAEDANAIIFFDEADALFGKRGEVKEARDRWANIEVNYLLQRVEEYAGVVIMASNLRQNIDEAFVRRIHMMVEFPAPAAEARFKIWCGMFPQNIQRPNDEDIQSVATRFPLVGRSIKNVVIDAAFHAIAEGRSDKQLTITMQHLVTAIAAEYQKLGKPITKGDFGETFYSWIEQQM